MIILLAGDVLTVADIMTRDVVVVAASASLEEVASVLVVRDVSAVPVRGPDGDILGVVSRADLLDAERIEAIQAASDPPGSRPLAGALATPSYVVAHPQDPAIDAVRMLVGEPAHRLLVLDERGELAGVVTPSDLMRALVPPPRPAEPPPPPPASLPPGADQPRTVH
jgi:CBS-domain-containing membrane protein